ncbi:MAG: 30S ribosomal protein S6 [Phycisphaerae bacterium]|nr:30S ribosomal protein S6 [Phycisphaerae bacterium]
METVTKRLYEGMFLVDSGLAAQDWQKVIDEIQRMMKRAEADVVSLKKWDERRMTYDIQSKSRGTYILVYFNCDPEKVKGIERDVQLSEMMMRVLVLRTDRMSQEDIEKATPAESAPAETHAAKADETKEDIAGADEEAVDDVDEAVDDDDEVVDDDEETVDGDDNDDEIA